MPALKVIVVTPETTVIDQQADFVVVPLFDGELGIGVGHSPLIGRLGYGELRIKVGDVSTHYYVDGGFVQVLNNEVSVLTNRAVPAKNLDSAAAREQLSAARARKANTPELLAVRDRLENQARAQLHVAQKARA